MTPKKPPEIYAAVAVILWSCSGSFRVLLVKRAKNPSDPWSEDWAFPGGRKEPRDASLYGTARRETLEETGIDVSTRARLLFGLRYYTPLITPWIKVKPFVFRLVRPKKVVLSPELEDYAWPRFESLEPARNGRTRPMYYFRRGEVVWGMTARILTDLMAKLLVKRYSTGC